MNLIKNSVGKRAIARLTIKLNKKMPKVTLRCLGYRNGGRINFKKCQINQTWLDENEVSATDACISYLKSLENIDVLVIGASTSKQLSEVITSFNKSRSLDYPAISSDDPGLVNPGLWA